jgi:hypothetical protein
MLLTVASIALVHNFSAWTAQSTLGSLFVSAEDEETTYEWNEEVYKAHIFMNSSNGFVEEFYNEEAELCHR